MLERIIVKGYKSFRELELSLGRINLLIGANGSGKSNFIQLFRMMNRIANRGLQVFVAQAGGADQLLHYGRKTTEKMHLEFWFDKGNGLANGYAATLIPTNEDTLLFEEETCYFHDRRNYATSYQAPVPVEHLAPHAESVIEEQSRTIEASRYVLEAMRSWQVYHFHDTSDSAKLKQTGDLHDNQFLRPDASNLAAYLYLLRERATDVYRNIVDVVRMVAPFFGDFVLRPSPFNPDKIRLEWTERGSDMLFGPHALSDGTLRFICLATLFLLPPWVLPRTIVLDEPELGLHPYAVAALAEMVRSAAAHTQVLLATQSVTLVNQFSPEELLAVERKEGASVIRRLATEEIHLWLEDYALGDLWEKNVLGGRPSALSPL
ncbi:MAG: AAA family ATPase [Thermoflexales bacterium]